MATNKMICTLHRVLLGKAVEKNLTAATKGKSAGIIMIDPEVVVGNEVAKGREATTTTTAGTRDEDGRKSDEIRLLAHLSEMTVITTLQKRKRRGALLRKRKSAATDMVAMASNIDRTAAPRQLLLKITEAKKPPMVFHRL